MQPETAQEEQEHECFFCKGTGRAQTFRTAGNAIQIAGFTECIDCEGTGQA